MFYFYLKCLARCLFHVSFTTHELACTAQATSAHQKYYMQNYHANLNFTDVLEICKQRFVFLLRN